MKEITIFDLLKLTNPNIIDIRGYLKYQAGHIPHSIVMDYSTLYYHPEQVLKKQETYYFYCDSGIRSKALVQHLIPLGYHAIHVIGGYNNCLLSK